MSQVPFVPETMFGTALNLPIDEVYRICRINRGFNRAICNNEHFWRLRSESDLGVTYRPQHITWKEQYRMLTRTWTLVGMFTEIDTNPSPRNIDIPVRDPIVQLDISETDIAMVDYSGRVWAMGENYEGLINGDPDTLYVDGPTKMDGTDGIVAVQVSCGYDYIYILDGDGALWSRGDDEYMNLGRDTGDDRTSLGKVQGIDRPAVHVECSNEYTVAVDIDRNMWAAGLVPHPGYSGGPLMQRLDVPFKVDRISCAPHHAMFIDLDGNLWGMGETIMGELGFFNDAEEYIAPRMLNRNRKVKDISCKGSHSAIVDADNYVWTCGSMDSGESGTGERGRTGLPFTRVLANVQKVSCSEHSTYAVGYDGVVFGTGHVYDRRMGRITAYKVFTNLGITVDGIVSGTDAVVYRDLHVV